MSMSCSLLELGNQEPAARLQHAIHLGNRSLLIIISNVVQSERAGDSVERALAERKLLGVPDLKAHRYAILARLCSGAVDHLRARINAVVFGATGVCHDIETTWFCGCCT